MAKILAISGSLRASSSNTALLHAASALAPDSMTISIYDGLGSLPHFNPELDGDEVLASVRNWRDQLKRSEGVLFCTPEYAHGVPGALKNALDWIVSSGEFMNKPTAVISASPSPDGGDKASTSLVQTLRVMMAEIVEGAILCIPAVSAKLNSKGEVTDLATAQALQALLTTLATTVNQR
ncbi:NAD(P)H-dependent oxidoreductase [Leptolyngbya sp. FACHB-36]|uniref:NADPH-dependent FMN reductase n=1 Tax=Leptolyngbya sp. FACHB-36 TaxID=2692808 RepID=UPI0016803121|nr:NADPH-dependent FMN reductase [Leptolyngbya sp. FACHB-36]MBD2020047.1 NAD(P)H-dependent oxidoreductase [Leptolyngbya sp. FACHB-36]